jgi:transcriptional regulator with XRE-family HTH domain
MNTGNLVQQVRALLIEYRVNSAFTQKEFAALLGIKEKQLQRYEANNFGSVIFKDLLRFLEAVGLEITVEVRKVRTIKNKPRKRQSSK